MTLWNRNNSVCRNEALDDLDHLGDHGAGQIASRSQL